MRRLDRDVVSLLGAEVEVGAWDSPTAALFRSCGGKDLDRGILSTHLSRGGAATFGANYLYSNPFI
ncbi:hypothetical protein GCM10028828_20490 [Corynebacterium tapiri]